MAMSASVESREREVRQEIDTFLNAIDSYPKRFEENPNLSFEDYLLRLELEGSRAGLTRRRAS